MKEFNISENFKQGFWGILNNWRIWLGTDELKAIHVGFDSSNTEISISILTDREPYFLEQSISPFSDEYGDWPVGDWRLNGVNKTWSHCFPDCADLLDWMKSKRGGEETDSMVQEGIVTAIKNPETVRFFQMFKNYSTPLPIRVVQFGEGKPYDFSLSF
jgi:hypothetical protein